MYYVLTTTSGRCL